MSATIRVSPSIQFLQRREPFDVISPPVGFHNRFSSSYYIRIRTVPLVADSSILPKKFNVTCGRITSLGSSRVEGLTQNLDSPISIELQPIDTEARFEQIISEIQQPHDAVIILWMAKWCRKCIYLKPKLEKLAAEYQPRIQFYCVDVNKVPHRLVSRAGVTKMPTIQLWKDAKKIAEVIGGHKAYLVVNEIREMIEDECSP